ncbi:MAG TPA: DUF423 domain-containing protein [Arenibaculum sp.]|nr:DUF423 domain-containing protein [Arenibaculum sp.]
MNRRVFGTWLAVAAVNAALAVAAGAFGAHGLQSAGEQAAGWMRTGSQYHMWHALALIAGTLVARDMPRGTFTVAANIAAVAWMAGIVLFCGALYGLALGAPRWLAMVAPLGGTAFLVGWMAAAAGGWSLRRDHETNGGPR